MSKTPSRQHHYIPKFYLKGFAKKPNKNGQLHLFDIQKRCWLPATHPKNLGTARDFNRVDIPGNPIDVLESSLSRFESEADRVLTEIRETKVMPKGNDLIALMNLVALISVRNPRVRESFRKSTIEVVEKISSLTLASKERFEDIVQRMKEDGKDLPDVSYEDVLQFHKSGEYDITIKNQFFYPGEFGALDAVIRTLLDRKWSFVVAEPGSGHFVCSDHPVSLRWTDPKLREGFYPPGHGCSSTEVVFPVSKDIAIIGTFEGENRTVHVNGRIVATVNTILLTTCTRHLYSPADDFFYVGADQKILSSRDL